MRQVTVDAVISVPRERVYDVVVDLTRRPSFTDHYLGDYRLARANPIGQGAAARFKLGKERGELSISEAERPRRIVEQGRLGRLGRSRMATIYDFIPESADVTRVELTMITEPKNVFDALKQRGIERRLKRQLKKSLERLRRLFEEPGDRPPARVTMAAYDSFKAPRFGAHVPTHGAPSGGEGE